MKWTSQNVTLCFKIHRWMFPGRQPGKGHVRLPLSYRRSPLPISFLAPSDASSTRSALACLALVGLPFPAAAPWMWGWWPAWRVTGAVGSEEGQ